MWVRKFWEQVDAVACLTGMKRLMSPVLSDDEDGMDAADNERRPHFPQFSYSASGREWALGPS